MVQLAANRTRFQFDVAGLDADLRVVGFEGTEGISRLFEIDLELASEYDDIAFDAVMGMRALLTVEGREGTRRINGVISRFELSDHGVRFTTYRASLVPYLWFFRHRQGSRIFQDLRVGQRAPNRAASLLYRHHRLEQRRSHCWLRDEPCGNNRAQARPVTEPERASMPTAGE